MWMVGAKAKNGGHVSATIKETDARDTMTCITKVIGLFFLVGWMIAVLCLLNVYVFVVV